MTTTVTLSISESDLFETLGNFLLQILPAGTAVLKAQANRVAETTAANFVMMTPSTRGKLGLNWTQFQDNYPSGSSVRTDLNPTDAVVQLDVHGPLSADNVQIIATLFWSEYACTIFQASGFDITPLYNSDPIQVPFENENQQIEYRWTVDLHMQVNAVTTVAQQFAASLDIELVSVEAEFKPQFQLDVSQLDSPAQLG